MLEQASAWGWLLIAAALLSLGLQFMHWRRGRITGMQALTGMIARGGFLVLGVIYVSDLIVRWPRAPLIGLSIVGFGIIAHLTVNTLHSIRRHR